MARNPTARRSFAYSLIGLPLIGAAWWAARSGRLNPYSDNANYRLGYHKPAGWITMAHSQQALFLYRHPATGIQLRGAVNQVISEINPTPELDRDGIAQYYVDRTRENMPGWTAEMGDVVESPSVSFRQVDREAPNHSSVTAYAVKGNTTVILTLMANGKHGRDDVQQALPLFRDYLSTVSLSETKLKG